ncbi:MAG: hypothetical protein H7837_07170 [Magnetococcus sp. MYC-9]
MKKGGQLPPPPSADALQREWLTNMSQVERIRSLELVHRLLGELLAPAPRSYYELLDLHLYQFLKQRLARRYYPSLHLFVWQRSLAQIHPYDATRLYAMLNERMVHLRPAVKQRLTDTTRHMALFAMLTDHFAEQGFLSVAYHVVSRISGVLAEKPEHLQAAVRLADHLDLQFDRRIAQWEMMEILP